MSESLPINLNTWVYSFILMTSWIVAQFCSRQISSFISSGVRPPTVMSTCLMKIDLFALMSGGTDGRRLILANFFVALSVSSLSIMRVIGDCIISRVSSVQSGQWSVQDSEGDSKNFIPSGPVSVINEFKMQPMMVVG